MKIRWLYVALALTVLGFAFIATRSEAATYTGSATVYAACDGSTTATASGRTVREGYVANNFLPFGTWIEMVKPKTIAGRRWFQVYDRGGPSFLIDVWSDNCAFMHAFGRQTVKLRTVPRSELYRGKPYKGWYLKKSKRGARLAWRPR
jgi:hypothetical protein